MYTKRRDFSSHIKIRLVARTCLDLSLSYSPLSTKEGIFILRHEGKEWVISVAEALKNAAEPSVGYVAFFSDVEHEVAPVLSGYRVMLTYNLYFTSAGTDAGIPKPLRNAFPQQQFIQDLLTDLIDHSTVLPKGGYLGFGLQHKYPVKPGKPVRRVQEYLKGPDAVLAGACTNLGVKWSVKVYYYDQFWETDPYNFIMDAVATDEDLGSESIVESMQACAQAVKYIRKLPRSDSEPQDDGADSGNFDSTESAKPGKSNDGANPGMSEVDADDDEDLVDLLVVTSLTTAPKISTEYAYYCDNQVSLESIHGHLCLVIQLKAVNEDGRALL